MQRYLVAPRLRYFDAVRRHQSIREASRELHISSSAVSRQIATLEEWIAAPLFDRLTTGLRLTAAGEALARFATCVIQEARRAENELNAVKGGDAGVITVVAVEGLNMDLLPTVMASVTARVPRLQINVLTVGSTAVQTALIGGDADIGMAFSLSKSADIVQRAVNIFALGAVMHSRHDLARRRFISLAECVDYPLILADPRLSIRKLLEPHLLHLEKPPNVVAEVNSIELMKNFAARNIGICFLSQLGIERELATKGLVHVPLIDTNPIVTELGIYVRANRILPTAAEIVLQALSDEVDHRAADDKRRLERLSPATPTVGRMLGRSSHRRKRVA